MPRVELVQTQRTWNDLKKMTAYEKFLAGFILRLCEAFAEVNSTWIWPVRKVVARQVCKASIRGV